MDTKLTLKLNQIIIKQAKAYAKENNTSLSRIIENYLSAITSKHKTDLKITPLVNSLTGVIQLTPDEDYKDAYAKYLENKYN